jgi:uncharacterized membrane protein
MKSDVFLFLMHALVILFMLGGTLWFWNILRFESDTQLQLEKLFPGNKTKFKWLFLAGLLTYAGSLLWKNV